MEDGDSKRRVATLLRRIDENPALLAKNKIIKSINKY